MVDRALTHHMVRLQRVNPRQFFEVITGQHCSFCVIICFATWPRRFTICLSNGADIYLCTVVVEVQSPRQQSNPRQHSTLSADQALWKVIRSALTSHSYGSPPQFVSSSHSPNIPGACGRRTWLSSTLVAVALAPLVVQITGTQNII